MPFQQVYNFDNEDNFTLSNAQIEDDVGKLGLVANPEQVFSEDFADDTGFTYDSALVEFVGGVLRQKSQRPTNALFHSKFTTKDGNWGAGVLTGTLNGDALISNGNLVLSGNVSNWEVTGTDNMPTGQSGWVEFDFTPNYSGSATNMIFTSSAALGNINNRARVFQIGLELFIGLNNSTGTAVVLIGAAFNPVAGTKYKIGFGWDMAGAGISRLFIDGVIVASQVATGTLGARGTLYLGRAYNDPAGNGPNAAFDNLYIASVPRYTANYTVVDDLPVNDYVTAKIDGPAFSYTGIGTVLTVDDGSVTEVGTPRYIVGGRYWDGDAWSISSGTYAQASSFATVIANLAAFNAAGATTIPWSVVFTDSNTQSSVDEFSIEVTGQKYSSTGYIEPSQPLSVKNLVDYTDSVVNTGNTDLKIILRIDGVLKYFNGTSWVTSNGLIAQANTAAQIADNVDELDLGLNSSVYFRWVMSSSVANETPEISTASVDYDFGLLESEPTTCLVVGFVRNLSGVGVANVKIYFSIDSGATDYHEANGNIASPDPVVATTDSRGYLSIPLIRSSQFENGGVYKVWLKTESGKIIDRSHRGKLLFKVTDSTTKDITDLLPIAS